MQFYWFLWYGVQSLLSRELSFMHTHSIYYPEGISLFYSNYYYYGLFLSLVLRFFFSSIQMFNLLILHTFVVAGVGGFLLLRYLTRNIPASPLGGFVFAFNPSHFAHSLHHVTITSIQFIPFFVLYFLRGIKENKRIHLFLVGLFLVLSSLCDWNYLVFGLIFIGLSYLYLAIRRKRLILFSEIKKIMMILAFSFLLLSPLIVPMFVLGLKHPEVHLSGHDTFVADALGFFVPHVYHLLSHWNWIEEINNRMTGTNWEKAVYLGIVNLVIIGWAIRSIFKEVFKYLLGLVIFMILAMGVSVHFMGQKLPIPLPYKLIAVMPFLTQARTPSRIFVFGYLFLAILVAFSVKHLYFSGDLSSRKKKFLRLTVVLIFLDYYSICRAVTEVSLPRCYQVIQQERNHDFGILELPWDGGRYMMYQTLHGIPDVQGYVGRRFEKTLNDRLEYDLKNLAQQKTTLIANRVKYIVIHKKKIEWNYRKAFDKTYFRAFQSVCKIYAQTYQKVYEDDQSATFKVY